MSRRDLEPKSVWTCDRCACTVEGPQHVVLPVDWRRWSKHTEHGSVMQSFDLCERCSGLLDISVRE